jgi:DHA3 family macrolide efflux protein-like MFS transporter
LRSNPEGSFRSFAVIWAGQTLSLIGSGLTTFVFAVWVFARTGSVTRFVLVALWGSLPGLLVSPLAGTYADRWSRRRSMMVSDLGSAAVVGAVAVFAAAGRLTTAHVCVAAGLASVLASLQWSAYSAAITMLVSERRLGRANGMVQLGAAAAQVLAPGLAALLLAKIALAGVLWVDFASFLIAAATVALVRIPEPPAKAPAAAAERSLGREVAAGWSYLSRRPDLLALLALLFLVNLLAGFNSALLTPMVLSFSRPAGLAAVVSFGSIGLLAGGLVMSATGGPALRVRGLFLLCLLFGAAFALAGIRPSVPLVAAANLAILFTMPLVSGISQVIWQIEVPPQLQGRVFALRRMAAQSSVPLGLLLAGPLADRLFEPFAAHSPLLARLLGEGRGRGMGLLYVLLGVGFLGAAFLTCRSPYLRRLDAPPPHPAPVNTADTAGYA